MKKIILIILFLSNACFAQEFSGNVKYIDGSLTPPIHTGFRNKVNADSGLWSMFRPVLVDSDTARARKYLASWFYVDSLFRTVTFTESDPVWNSEKSSYLTIASAATTYEPVFLKGTAFNKDFGSTSNTVAEGNDSRINNGQTAFGWGNHATAGYVTATSTTTFTNKSGNISQWTNDAAFITSSDLSPYLTTSAAAIGYIRNQNASAQTATFWINGNARFGLAPTTTTQWNNFLQYSHTSDAAIVFKTGNTYQYEWGIGSNTSGILHIGWRPGLSSAISAFYSTGNVAMGATTDNGLGKLQVTGNGWVSGSMQTGAPTGSTARPFKIGDVSTTSPTAPNRTIAIEINGTTYYLSAKTTND